MKSSESKVQKYVRRIDELLTTNVARADTIMSIHGNLNFAANVAPFGRPFLATLSKLIIGQKRVTSLRLGS